MIRLEHVHRIFQVGEQKVHALNDLMLHIGRGEYLSIMGPSGSGKSTLLNILGILDRSTSGRYLLDGTDVTSLTDDQQASTRREKIGFVFQFFHLVPHLTAEQNIELPLVLAGVPPAERKTRTGRVLEAVGLEERAHHRPEELSGGQRQRVAIARATIMGNRSRLTIAHQRLCMSEDIYCCEKIHAFQCQISYSIKYGNNPDISGAISNQPRYFDYQRNHNCISQ